jgi:hypothetical protein
VISRSGYTADTVDWYINDQDILTVTATGSSQITLYFSPSQYSLDNSVIFLIQSTIGYRKQISSYTYTNSSITFDDPGDLPNFSGMIISWSKPRTVISTTVISTDNNKTSLVNKIIFDKNKNTGVFESPTLSNLVKSSIKLRSDTAKLQTIPGKSLLKVVDGPPLIPTPGKVISAIILRSDNNQKSSFYNTATQISSVTKVLFGKNNTAKIFELPLSNNLIKSAIKLRSDTTKLQTISGKILPLKLADGPPDISKSLANLQKPLIQLRPDSSYSSPVYTSTSTESVVYDSYYAVVTGSSETGVTTDAVSWYIDDKDILTVVSSGSKVLTLFFDPIQDSLSGLTVAISHGPTNYYRAITNFTSTRSSITFSNPGDIVGTSGMILTWTRPRTVITAAAIGQDTNKTPLVNKAIFGKKLPQARVSSVTKTIYVDTPLPVIGRSSTESTANTVNWYINDQDILNTEYLVSPTVTLYLVKQNIQTFTAGSQVRLANYREGYVRQFTLISATDISITFSDPGDLPGISGLNVIASVAQTITDFQTDTYLSNTTEIFESPISSNLVKSSIKLHPDAAKLQTISVTLPIKLTDGPPNISRSLANLQKSLIQLRPDSSYSSPTYTSTSTTSVTYDNYSVAVTGSDVSTANTVAWYIEDRDILTVFPTGSSLITLYFAPGPDSVAGAVIQLVQNAIGYTRTITSFTYTSSSITFLDPKDLPSTGGMTINWSRPKPTITATAIGQNLNKIPLVSKAIFGKNNSVEIFNTPKINNLTYKQLVQLRAESAVFKTVGKVKIPLKLIPTGEIFTTAKLLTFAILTSDRTKLTTDKLDIKTSKSFKLTDDVSIKLVLGQGQIIKLRTGNFKLGSVGIQDPAAQKKEPIQFWN